MKGVCTIRRYGAADTLCTMAFIGADINPNTITLIDQNSQDFFHDNPPGS